MTPDLVDEAIARIPIIRLHGRLIVALQGDLTDRQAALLCSDVLERIQQTGAQGVLIDISGMWLVDSHLCSVLARLMASVRLMGARAVLCGMSPEVALTLQSMGISFDGVETTLGMEEGLTALGVKVVVEQEREQSYRILADALLSETLVKESRK